MCECNCACVCEHLSLSWLSLHHPMTRWFKRKPRKSTSLSRLQLLAALTAPPQVPPRPTLRGQIQPPLPQSAVLPLHHQLKEDLLVGTTNYFSWSESRSRSDVTDVTVDSVWICLQVKNHKNHQDHRCQSQGTEDRPLKVSDLLKGQQKKLHLQEHQSKLAKLLKPTTVTLLLFIPLPLHSPISTQSHFHVKNSQSSPLQSSHWSDLVKTVTVSTSLQKMNPQISI